jgi:hypothetical protein
MLEIQEEPTVRKALTVATSATSAYQRPVWHVIAI